MESFTYGFRIVGPTWERRRLVDAGAALAGYAACNDRAEVYREAYLSAFALGADFRKHLEATGSTRGYTEACGAAWLWFDIDRESDLARALQDARRLALAIAERFTLDDDDLLTFFSGAKGFHLGLPTCLWRPAPALDFNRVARRFAGGLAERAGVTIDVGVYD